MAAGLEQMLLEPASARHVLHHFQQTDFEQGKAHIVAKLRGIVADHFTSVTAETLLETVLTCVRQKNIGGRMWRDLWDP